MAEHLNQPPASVPDAFAMIGKRLGFKARQVGYEHCQQMGLNKDRAYACVNAVAEQLERDKPYEAQAAGMQYLDLTGTYRLFAVLLTEAAADQA